MTRRLKLADLNPEPVEVELADGQTFTIDRVTVDEMMSLFVIEEPQDADADDQVAGASAAYRRLQTSQATLNELFRARYPDFSDYSFTPAEIAGIFQAITGQPTIADEIRETLSDAVEGTTPDGRPETQEDGSEAADGAEAASGGTDGAPLASETPSPTSSSGSESSFTGEESGGETASPGPPSGATFAGSLLDDVA